MKVNERIIEMFNTSIDIKTAASEVLPLYIAAAGQKMVNCLIQDGKILVCGNGTSASLSQLLATCLLNRFERERPGLPALALSSDSAILTSIANENSYNEVFAKQIRALGQPNDILVVISSSGRSANILQAIQAAHDRDMFVISLTGGDGGDIASLLTMDDSEIRAPTHSTTLIQQVHQLVIYILCDVIDNYLFGHNE